MVNSLYTKCNHPFRFDSTGDNSEVTTAILFFERPYQAKRPVTGYCRHAVNNDICVSLRGAGAARRRQSKDQGPGQSCIRTSKHFSVELRATITTLRVGLLSHLSQLCPGLLFCPLESKLTFSSAHIFKYDINTTLRHPSTIITSLLKAVHDKVSTLESTSEKPLLLPRQILMDAQSEDPNTLECIQSRATGNYKMENQAAAHSGKFCTTLIYSLSTSISEDANETFCQGRHKMQCCVFNLCLVTLRATQDAVLRLQSMPGDAKGDTRCRRHKMQCCVFNLCLVTLRATQDAVLRLQSMPGDAKGDTRCRRHKMQCCVFNLCLVTLRATQDAVLSLQSMPGDAKGDKMQATQDAVLRLQSMPGDAKGDTRCRRHKMQCCVFNLCLVTLRATQDAVLSLQSMPGDAKGDTRCSAASSIYAWATQDAVLSLQSIPGDAKGDKMQCCVFNLCLVTLRATRFSATPQNLGIDSLCVSAVCGNLGFPNSTFHLRAGTDSSPQSERPIIKDAAAHADKRIAAGTWLTLSSSCNSIYHRESRVWSLEKSTVWRFQSGKRLQRSAGLWTGSRVFTFYFAFSMSPLHYAGVRRPIFDRGIAGISLFSITKHLMQTDGRHTETDKARQSVTKPDRHRQSDRHGHRQSQTDTVTEAKNMAFITVCVILNATEAYVLRTKMFAGSYPGSLMPKLQRTAVCYPVQALDNGTTFHGLSSCIIPFFYRGRGGSHQGDPGSIPGRVTPDFRLWESCRTMPLVGGFSRGSPVPPPFHSGAAPYSPQSPSSLKTSILQCLLCAVYNLPSGVAYRLPTQQTDLTHPTGLKLGVPYVGNNTTASLPLVGSPLGNHPPPPPRRALRCCPISPPPRLFTSTMKDLTLTRHNYLKAVHDKGNRSEPAVFLPSQRTLATSATAGIGMTSAACASRLTSHVAETRTFQKKDELLWPAVFGADYTSWHGDLAPYLLFPQRESASSRQQKENARDTGHIRASSPLCYFLDGFSRASEKFEVTVPCANKTPAAYTAKCQLGILLRSLTTYDGNVACGRVSRQLFTREYSNKTTISVGYVVLILKLNRLQLTVHHCRANTQNTGGGGGNPYFHDDWGQYYQLQGHSGDPRYPQRYENTARQFRALRLNSSAPRVKCSGGVALEKGKEHYEKPQWQRFWAAPNEVLRVIEASMEQRRNERVGEMADPQENPPTRGIMALFPPCENPGVTRPGIESALEKWIGAMTSSHCLRIRGKSGYRCTLECLLQLRACETTTLHALRSKFRLSIVYKQLLQDLPAICLRDTGSSYTNLGNPRHDGRQPMKYKIDPRKPDRFCRATSNFGLERIYILRRVVRHDAQNFCVGFSLTCQVPKPSWGIFLPLFNVIAGAAILRTCIVRNVACFCQEPTSECAGRQRNAHIRTVILIAGACALDLYSRDLGGVPPTLEPLFSARRERDVKTRDGTGQSRALCRDDGATFKSSRRR
ncbi:hypothetical protein PR048_026775 [Dryococelus australis]|uniref:Uncharacterized protein n=1 Tax=Dryococelus australis TaxID=614101 RepID=A0ABQ9GMB9_9NEOP|nr:hypothetical protein PR048_026775 [Dryococelus australis]